jgi:anaerobic magnesium-protoporphyrin IX monomethyl ester cyclase
MRGDNATPEILDAAKAANFQMIAYGLETGSERLMKLIDKGETVAEVAEAVKMTARHGLAAATTIIFGLPSETREDRRQGVRLVTELPLSSVRFNTLVPYPGTPAFAQLQPQGKILVKDDWANFGVQYMWEGDDIPYVPEGTGRFELMFETMFANLTYYLSPRGLLRMFKSSFAGGNVVKLSHNWFLSPQTMWRLSRVGLLLCGRFLVVTCRMLGEKLSRGGRA